MRKVIAAAVALAAFPVAWEAAASALWANATGRAFEPLGWWHGLSYWHANWWCKLLLVGSGVPPTVISVLLLSATIMVVRARKKPNIFGETGWADTSAEMQKGGIRLTRRLP